MAIEPFVLPRLDWYDEEGRIYKDALIENFNALEAKIQEVNALSAFSSTIPDISTIHLDDVTLSDDLNKIVNLKSFLEIFDLIRYPIELTFSATKIKRLAYWDENYDYIEKSNLSTKVDEDNPFIVYNFTTQEARKSSTVSNLASDEVCLGRYTDGRVIAINTPFQARLNLMYLLGTMNKRHYTRSSSSKNPGLFYFPKGSKGQQGAGIMRAESRGGGKNLKDSKFTQEGRID